jgi:hypothetical protein
VDVLVGQQGHNLVGIWQRLSISKA